MPGVPFYSFTATDYSGSIASGGIAQSLMPAAIARASYTIQNTSTDNLYIDDTGGVATVNSFFIRPGGSYQSDTDQEPVSSISIYGPTTGQTFVASDSVATQTGALIATPVFDVSDTSASIAAANISQPLLSGTPLLSALVVSNTSNQPLWLNITGQAAVPNGPGSYVIAPGTSYESPSNGFTSSNISIVGVQPGQTFTAVATIAEQVYPSGDWGGGGVWGGGGTWNGLLLSPVKIQVLVPFNPGRLENVVPIPDIATTVTNLFNVNFTQLSAQPNLLGNEIDIFITNPGNLTGTLVRSMQRNPQSITDGYVLSSGVPLLFYADFGLAPEKNYYYTWFPNNGDAPLTVACQSTSAYNILGYVWDSPEVLPQIYKTKDAEAIPDVTSSTSIVYHEYNDMNSFYLADAGEVNPNQVIQIGNDIVCIRQVDYQINKVYVTPALTSPPEPDALVILQGLGFPLKRFLKVFCEQLDYIYSRIKALLPNREIENCESKYIPYLAKFVGLGQIINSGGVSDVLSARNQVKSAVKLYQIKGTEDCIRQLVQAIVGPSYGIQIDYMKDMLMFTNTINSFNGTLRNDTTANTQNQTTYLKQGKYGDILRYTPDASNGAIYAPYVVRITIQAISNFDRIPQYTNAILAIISQFLPEGVNFYLLWDTTQPTLQFTGPGFGITFSPSVTQV